jgi:hypothetical protein
LDWFKNALFIDWIKSHPQQYADLTIKRLRAYFEINTDWFTQDYGWNHILFNKRDFESRFHHYLFICFFMGLLLLRKQKTQLIFLAITVFYFIGLSSLFYMSPRYRLPAMPFMLIYCGYAIYWVGGTIKKIINRRVPKPSVSKVKEWLNGAI